MQLWELSFRACCQRLLGQMTFTSSWTSKRLRTHCSAMQTLPVSAPSAAWMQSKACRRSSRVHSVRSAYCRGPAHDQFQQQMSRL